VKGSYTCRFIFNWKWS